MTTTPKDCIPKVSVGMSVPPMITTIIPTYRRPNLLRRAIKSVLNQAYSNFQVCVYDNASGDETAQVVAEFAKKDPRVKYHCHATNIGGFANFDYGMRHVETPFFSFLSDDDIILPAFYQMALASFEKHPDAAFCSTDVICVTSEGIISGTCHLNWEDGYYLPPNGLLAMFTNGRTKPTWTGILFRRMVIEHIGMLSNGCGSDLDYVLRIAANFPFIISKEPGAIFVSHRASFSSVEGVNAIWPGNLKILRNLTDDSRIPLVIKDQISGYFINELKWEIFNHGTYAVRAKRYDEAYKIASILYEDLNARFFALIIYIATKGCKYFPFLHGVLIYLNNLHRRLVFKKKHVLSDQLKDIVNIYVKVKTQ